MKKKTIILLFLGVVLGNSIPAQAGLGVFVGATYNPLNPDYIMGAMTIDAYLGKHFIWESRLAYGSLTYTYKAPNPFTVEGEITELWAKGSVMEATANFIWRYTINDVIGLRFGFGLPWFFSPVYEGLKPGLGSTKGAFMTFGIHGILGIEICPIKKLPIQLTVSPGGLLNWYASEDKYDNIGAFPFNLPISLLIGWRLL